MKLLFDVGNSRIKWVWLNEGSFLRPGAMSHRGASIAAIAEAIGKPDRQCSGILLASVADPGWTASLIAGLEAAFAVPVRVAESEVEALGVRNGYLQPAHLGVDRWLAMLAAYHRWRTALCVVDVGTAVTIDVVAADGVHQGGGIIPGIALMRDSLLCATGRIRAAAGDGRETAANELLGRDTESCIRQGTQLACAGLVEACVRAFRESAGQNPVLVLTGGDAGWLCKRLSIAAELCPMLVFEGLALRFGQELYRGE